MRVRNSCYLLLVCMLVAGPAQAAELTGQELVAHVERLLWGKTNQGLAEMTVITPRWERKIELRFWMERPERTFIRILAPAKEAGIGSLRRRIEEELRWSCTIPDYLERETLDGTSDQL